MSEKQQVTKVSLEGKSLYFAESELGINDPILAQVEDQFRSVFGLETDNLTDADVDFDIGHFAETH